ncbi:hypothetical protein [Leptolyngbya sp. FACHB-261]|uniref:hypothetical protein n=1 Tax=Leptolyngbya sp. FACHB-261 TaxID=2692806 RepID=UPI001681FDDB|nr:hypothetical protein [Leptolyngbya sp. FACHB-261]MBD2101899.1 hypothetical protein [Leptolyngbya sp. FACHB-261]
MPHLLEATKEYWKKLDELETAYQRGEVSLEEVDAKVPKLMAELGQERRAALAAIVSSWSRLWDEQRETVVGMSLLGIFTWIWLVLR